MRMDRRRFLRAAGWAAAGTVVVSKVGRAGLWAQPAWADSGSVRVHVVVIDGLRPDHVDQVRTPFLLELAADGTFWPDARAEMVAETTPNHVAMLTGMRADRHGIPGNAIPARAGFNPRVGDNPRYLNGDSLFTVARRQAPDMVTASVTSKEYLVHVSEHDRVGDGEPDATHVYQPRVFIPESDHETDHLVMEEVHRVTADLDPHFLFVNLGDVDRVGHTDVSAWGTALQAQAWYEERVSNVDRLLRLHVEQLKQEGKWEQTVYIVTADHSMDWSLPHSIVHLHPAFQDDELLRDHVVMGVNGGAAMYALRHPDAPRADERRRRIREIATATEGVRSALYTQPNPADGDEEHWVGRVWPEWGLTGDRAGDVVVEVEPGYRITEPSETSNPIPGNHGHAHTLPIPLIVSGGWEGLRRDQVVTADGEPAVDEHPPGVARNIDIAPTVAWLLGLGPARGGFDGRVLDEAFVGRPAAPVDVSDVVPGPRLHRHGGVTVDATSVAVSSAAFPDGADAVTIISADAPVEALAAVTFTVGHGAPILLGRRDGLADVVVDEIRRLEPDRAFLIGREEALGPQVVADLERAGLADDDIRRIAGADRYGTARFLAEEVGAAHGEAVLVAGEDGGTSVSVPAGPVAAAAGRPVLLTRVDEVPDATWDAIEAAGVERIIIAGGTQDVSGAVEASLRDAGLVVERVGGADLDASGHRLAERSVREGGLTDVVWVVGSSDLAVGLTGAAAAAAGSNTFADTEEDDGPFWFMASGVADLATSSLIVVPPDRLAHAPEAERFLRERRHAFVHVRLVGGAAELSPGVQDEIRALLGSDDDPDAPAPATPPERGEEARTGPVLPATGAGGALAGAATIGLAEAVRRASRADGDPS